MKFIIYALASKNETTDHLDTFIETGSLTDAELYDDLHKRLEIPGGKQNNFLKRISGSHGKPGSVSEPTSDIFINQI